MHDKILFSKYIIESACDINLSLCQKWSMEKFLAGDRESIFFHDIQNNFESLDWFFRRLVLHSFYTQYKHTYQTDMFLPNSSTSRYNKGTPVYGILQERSFHFVILSFLISWEMCERRSCFIALTWDTFLHSLELLWYRDLLYSYCVLIYITNDLISAKRTI